MPAASGQRRGASAKAQAVKAEQKAAASSQNEDDMDMHMVASVLQTDTDQASQADEAAVPLMDRLAGIIHCLMCTAFNPYQACAGLGITAILVVHHDCIRVAEQLRADEAHQSSTSTCSWACVRQA